MSGILVESQLTLYRHIVRLPSGAFTSSKSLCTPDQKERYHHAGTIGIIHCYPYGNREYVGVPPHEGRR
jgi:hypothetical protein